MDGVLRRMNRILARFAQRTLEPAEQAAIVGYFAAHRPRISAALDAFAADMHALTAAEFPRAGTTRRRTDGAPWPGTAAPQPA